MALLSRIGAGKFVGVTLLVAVVGAGCASAPAHRSSTPSTRADQVPPPTQLPPTTQVPPNTPQPTPTTLTCSSGTVTVTANPPGEGTPLCVHVGATIVLQGGDAMSGGTWPGPPDISETTVLSFVSSHPTGATFTGTFRAVATGSATVTVPFVAGPDVCDPTPCTPVPGAPIQLAVTVVP